MVQFCCVVGCGNRSNREKKKFFRLPNIPKTLDKSSAKALLISKRRSQWLLNISRIDLKDGDSAYSPGYIRVCSDHFYSGRPSELTDVDSPDWAPTLKMGHSLVRMKGSKRKRAMLGFPPSARKRKKTDDKEIAPKKKQIRRKKTETVQKKSTTQAKKTVQRRPQARGKAEVVQRKKQIQERKVTILKNIMQAKKTVVPINRQICQIPIYIQDDKPYKSPFIHKITAECIVLDDNYVVKSPEETEDVEEKSDGQTQVKEEYDFMSDVKVELDLSLIKDEPVL